MGRAEPPFGQSLPSSASTSAFPQRGFRFSSLSSKPRSFLAPLDRDLAAGKEINADPRASLSYAHRIMSRTSQPPSVTLQIVYQPPERADAPRSSSRHERQLEGVPEPTARRMLRDFATYQARPGAANQREAYTYQQTGPSGAADDEVMAALDFGEIAALNPSGEEVPVQKTEVHRPVSR
jgi:hypothetical protein